MSIDTLIDQAFAPISSAVSSVVFYTEPFTGYDIRLILIWLAGVAIFFTLYLGLPNLKYFGHAISIARGRYDRPTGKGQINSLQALMMSLSGTVGLGNIAGVAVAISVGGPGAAFWLCVMGILSMATKLAESTMGVKYRHSPDPSDHELTLGGPMYYIRAAFSQRGLPKVGKFIAYLFCICCIGGAIGGGNMFQANQTFQQVVNVSGGAEGFMADKGWMFGIFLAVLTGIVVIGGVTSIARLSSKIVPVMATIYLGAGLYVLAVFYADIPGAFVTIITSAFSPEAGMGAVIGAILMGVQRAAFSNEAGMGSGAIVHAAAKTDEPLTQGFVGMLGPFIDTVAICMMTALVIVVTGAYEGTQGMAGVELSSRAFEQGISWFPYILAVTVFLFAFSTLITWCYLGEVCAVYLFGKRSVVIMTYKVIFLCFTVVGSAATLSNIIDFSDAIFLSMAVPNCIALLMLAPELKRDMRDYLQRLENKQK
ncbi:MAG: alanine:cation symporter family protein [Alphaproteobacteria bacterium]|nr:alanine:cation symporter family protein [Alphaproteobacteria bacterium]